MSTISPFTIYHLPFTIYNYLEIESFPFRIHPLLCVNFSLSDGLEVISRNLRGGSSVLYAGNLHYVSYSNPL